LIKLLDIDEFVLLVVSIYNSKFLILPNSNGEVNLCVPDLYKIILSMTKSKHFRCIRGFKAKGALFLNLIREFKPKSDTE